MAAAAAAVFPPPGAEFGVTAGESAIGAFDGEAEEHDGEDEQAADQGLLRVVSRPDRNIPSGLSFSAAVFANTERRRCAGIQRGAKILVCAG